MADRHDSPHDLEWYRDRWEELLDLFPTSDPTEVLPRVRELKVSVLDEEAEALDDMGLADAEEAKTVLRRLFERLQELRRENEAVHRLQELVEADSPTDALDAVQALQRHVEALEEQQTVLAEAGFDHPDHAIKAIASMQEQLGELYSEKEATEQSNVETALAAEGDTFDQLQALMAREEKLQRELGVSSPEAVIEMVEGLTDQLEDLYLDRDATASPDTIFDVSPPASQESTLQTEVGVSDPNAISALIRSMEEQLQEVYEEREKQAQRHTLPDDAPLLDQNTFDRLETLDDDALNALSVGVFCVDDQGRIRRINERALQWPDVTETNPEALLGANFFSDIAPGTQNTLFQGRFEQGVDDGAMDEHFLYTYVSKRAAPTNLAVHLHRKPNQPDNWIVFRLL